MLFFVKQKYSRCARVARYTRVARVTLYISLYVKHSEKELLNRGSASGSALAEAQAPRTYIQIESQVATRVFRILRVARTPRRVRHFGSWLRQDLFVRHLKRKSNTKKTLNKLFSVFICIFLFFI